MSTTSTPIASAPIQPFTNLWTVAETASALRISTTLVYRLAERGELPSIKISNRLRFDPEAVRGWLESKATKATV